MNKLLTLITMIILTFSVSAVTVTDVYDLTLKLKVPQVLNNNNSLGERRYKSQTITGQLYISYDTEFENRPVISISNLVNKSFKVGGRNVTYTAEVNDNEIYTRLVLIGSNKTGKFNTASTCFYVEAMPNYAIGGVDEDNSFYILLAGQGTTALDKKSGIRYIKRLNGYATGTQGCGCYAYGHISPTRVAGYIGATDQVDDVACVHGTWTAKINKNKGRKFCISCR